MTSPIDQMADKVIARIRTVVPAVWGIIVAQVITWLIGKELIPHQVESWSGWIIGATTTVVTGLLVLAAYSFAQWVEARSSPLARFVARVLLVILKAPSYSRPVNAHSDQRIINDQSH